MKQKFLFTILFLFIAVSFTDAQTTKSTELEQQFIALQRAEEDAEDKRDIAALDRILADEFIFIAGNGSIYDKKKFLDEIKAHTEPAPAQTLTYENFKVRRYGKTAAVNYLLVVSGKDKDGKDTLSRYRMSSVWVKQKGNWRLANIHATRVRP